MPRGFRGLQGEDEGRSECEMLAVWQLSSSLAAQFRYSCKRLKIKRFILVIPKLRESWNGYCARDLKLQFLSRPASETTRIQNMWFSNISTISKIYFYAITHNTSNYECERDNSLDNKLKVHMLANLSAICLYF